VCGFSTEFDERTTPHFSRRKKISSSVAMRGKHVDGVLERGEIIACLGREDADARMESWKYDPWLIAESDIPDRCSLYLSLRRSADEGVQKELGSFVNGFLR